VTSKLLNNFVTDKPRWFWLFTAAGLAAMFAGLVGFLASPLGLTWLVVAMIVVAMCFFGVMAVAAIGCAAGMFSGRYRKLVPRPLLEQEW
jgi:uncharacterized oligopeptide transporter (OPT) family protein